MKKTKKKKEGVDEKFEEYVEYRLKEWAQWFEDGMSFGLGYANRTIEYRLMTEGFVARRKGQIILPSNIEAEEVEGYVNELWKKNEKLAVALRIHYCKYKKSRDRCPVLKVSSTRFGVYVEVARGWIASRLDLTYSG